MKAAILVGGVGSRMRPLTYIVNKAMLPLGGKPLLERTLDYLKQYGFDDVVLCVAYLKKQIMDYFGDGSAFGVSIEYAESENPLGTAGQLRTARSILGNDTFIAMNGDIFTSLDLEALVEYHGAKEAVLTIALKAYEVKMPYGKISLNGEGRILEFVEKPKLPFLANAGIYVAEPEIFNYFPEEDPSNLEYDVFPKIIQAQEKIVGFESDAFWGDIGRLSDYEKLNGDALNNGLLEKVKRKK